MSKDKRFVINDSRLYDNLKDEIYHAVLNKIHYHDEDISEIDDTDLLDLRVGAFIDADLRIYNKDDTEVNFHITFVSNREENITEHELCEVLKKVLVKLEYEY